MVAILRFLRIIQCLSELSNGYSVRESLSIILLLESISLSKYYNESLSPSYRLETTLSYCLVILLQLSNGYHFECHNIENLSMAIVFQSFRIWSLLFGD